MSFAEAREDLVPSSGLAFAFFFCLAFFTTADHDSLPLAAVPSSSSFCSSGSLSFSGSGSLDTFSCSRTSASSSSALRPSEDLAASSCLTSCPAPSAFSVSGFPVPGAVSCGCAIVESPSDAAFVLTVRGFLLTVELLCLQLCFGSFLAYSWSFFTYSWRLFAYSCSFFCLQWESAY